MRTKYGNWIPHTLLFIVLSFIIIVPSHSQDLVWSTNYGGNYNDEAYSGVPTTDDCIAIIGSTYSNGAGEFDFYLLKVNSAGDTVWCRTYGGADTEYGYDIKQTYDDGYILVGSTQSFGSGGSDIYMIRTDSEGNKLWDKTYGGVTKDEGYSVEITSDKGFIICGNTDSYGAGYSDLYLIKTDSLGDTLWTRTFGGSGGESGVSVKQLSDDSYIAIGSTGSFGTGYSSLYVVKTTADGDSLWAKTYGGTRADFGSDIAIAFDGGLLLSGWTASYGAGFYDGYLVKTDADGNFQWSFAYGGAKEDRIYSVQQAMDGGYILTGIKEGSGSSLMDIYVIKTDPTGNPIWERTYGGSKSDFGRMIFQEPNHDYMLIGYTYSYSSGGSDIYILKLSGESTDSPIDPYAIPSGYELAQNYPNPFNMSTRIEFELPRISAVKLTIYNILGEIVRDWTYDIIYPGGNCVTWDGKNNYGDEIASGIYFYRLTAGEFIETKKMVLVK
ncbi:MAG: T9SS type A sorting domain-containing protein [candidate division Zixibacteria bacterium]|nr:T9SS type A sorting domain-containing protein [candidate division Zixibacteria bacterium]